jgi:N-acetyl-anhydromuramyl-L-alanine amidase AmpD
MIKVWVILGAAMTVAALAGTTMLPREDTPAAGTALPNLDGIIWPKGMAHVRPWRFIIIHHSATPAATVEAIAQTHRGRGFQDVGYHFIVNNGRAAGTSDGEITPTARWLEQLPGAHTSVADHPEFNAEGIGICLVGNFDLKPPTPIQMTSLQLLVLALRDRCNIPLERVIGHGELKETHCPGRFFPMETFLMDLRTGYVKHRLLAPPPND